MEVAEIAALSAFNNTFENTPFSCLTNHLEKFNFSCDKQFGYKQNFSTSLAISIIQDQLLKK